jgi:putative DNA primase/helicase
MHPKQFDSWQVDPHLWGGVIAPPGSKKTPATSDVFKLLTRLEIKAGEAYDETLAAYKMALVEHKAELKAISSTLEKLRKDRLAGKSKEGSDQREAELKNQRDELLKNEPEHPVLHRYRVNDPTIEALQDILKKDPKCILLERDELIGMLAQWEMKGHEMDRSFYLEAHAGLRGYHGVRVVRGEFRIPILCLSLYGGIQPIKLVQYLRDPKINLSHDGAIQRFQLLVYPNPMKDYTYTDQAENTEAKNRFFAVLAKIATTKDFQDFGAIVTEYENVPFFTFENEAQQIFKHWLIGNEKKIANEPDNAIKEHLAKFPDLFARLCIIFHVIELADNSVRNQEPIKQKYVPVRHANMAVQWCSYLESHARRIYALAKNPSLAAALALSHKLQDPGVSLGPWPENGFTAHDVERKHWTGLNLPSLISSALARLEESHWIRVKESIPSKNGGRPAIRYEINPEILVKRAENRGFRTTP